MGYRRSKSDADKHREWTDWIAAHGEELAALGIPYEVFQDESRWDDFLDHGYLDHHPRGVSWSHNDLSAEQKRALTEVLAERYGHLPRRPHVLRYIDPRDDFT